MPGKFPWLTRNSVRAPILTMWDAGSKIRFGGLEASNPEKPMQVRPSFDNTPLPTYKFPVPRLNNCFVRSCKHQAVAVLISILALMFFVSSNIRAQGKLTLIVKDTTSIPPGHIAREVTCVRGKLRPPVTVNMNLEVGDRLISNSRNIKVRINCQGADFILSAPFRLDFLAPRGKGCYAGYWSRGGELIANTHGNPTHVQAGNAGMASRRTIFAIESTSESRWSPFPFPRRTIWKWLAFKDPVNINMVAGESRTEAGSLFRQGLPTRSSFTIGEGKKLTAVGNKPPVIGSISRQEREQAAGLLAVIDASYFSDPQQRNNAFSILRTLYGKLLAEPHNQQNQRNLWEEQKRLGIPPAESLQSPSGPAGPPSDLNPLVGPPTKAIVTYPQINDCRQPHKFRVTPRNLPFAHLPSAGLLTIPARGRAEIQFEFDTAGEKTGVYQGEFVIECLDCVRERGCGPIIQPFPFTVTVK